MLRWKSSLKPAAAAPPATGIALENSAVTTAVSYSTPTNIDVNIPAVSANDILLLLVTGRNFSEPTDSPPSGWTKIAEQDGSSVSNPTVAAYWKRASSSASATTETWSSFFPNGETYYIWVGAYSGCVTSGSPVDAYGSVANSYSSSLSVDVTTTTADTMIVTMAGCASSTITHTWPDGTELIDTAYPGTVATVSINEKLEATTGSKTRTVTPSTSVSNTMIAVALKPPATSYVYEEDFEGSGTPSGFTNTIVGSGTIDYDYTTDPGSGSESLEVVTSGGDSFAEVDFGAIYDNFELIFQNKVASGGSNRTWIALSDDSNYSSPEHIVIGFVSGWNYGFNHNFNPVTRSTTGVILGNWHWVKLNVDIPNNTITLTISASSDFSSADVATTTSQTFGSSFGGVRYARFGGRNRDMTVLVDSITLEDLSPTYILEERFEESDSGGALGSATDGYDSSLVSSEVTTTGSTIDPDESTTAVLSGSQSLEIDSASGDNYVEFDLGADYDELWFHVEINRRTSSVNNRTLIKFFDQAGTASDTLSGNGSNKATVGGASATGAFSYANNSAVDHFWLHWVRNSTSTFYWGQNTSTRPTSGGDVVSFTAANVAIGKFQIGIFNRSGNYRYDDILVSTSEIGDDP